MGDVTAKNLVKNKSYSFCQIKLFKPIETNGHEVEYRGGAAHNVHGQVEVAHLIWQVPVTPVGLKVTENPIR